MAWLEGAGNERIVLVDNASTYEPLLDYLKGTSHDVVRLGRNLGSRALWLADLVPNEPFVWTDPDVVPLDACPLDAVAYLRELLDKYPDAPKAALGLHLGDVPSDLRCLEWEWRLLHPQPGDMWRGEIAPGVYDSLCDTTFALYRPGAEHGFHSLRTGYPYQVRHMPWYETATEAERVERAYYFEHAKGGAEFSTWKGGAQT